MFSEDDLLPISALQHLVFCERQCALIHIERAWAENRLTVEGRHLHEKTHQQGVETRDGVRIVRGLQLRSLRLGLSGVADVVEFHLPPTTAPPRPPPGAPALAEVGAPVMDASPPGAPFPVEYKRGRPKANDCDRIQLCAQALCLEEMLGAAVPAGALFYGRTRRRKDVRFGVDLRQRTVDAAARLHALLASGRTPPAVRESKCGRCSLANQCLPEIANGRRSAAAYIARQLRALDQADRADSGDDDV